MSRSKIVLLGGVVLAAVVFLAGVGLSPRPRSGQGPGAVPGQASSSQYPPGAVPANGFLPSSGGRRSLSAGNDNQPPTFNGKPVASLDDVLKIVLPPLSPSVKVPAAPLLALPSVSDSEIVIDASGPATVLDYLAYFNAHAASGISFDNKRFGSVLKDENGVLLFTPDLIDKAVVGNSFSEIHDSLVIQKDFAAAEIAFLKSVKVTGSAIPLHKETIGFEKLLINLIDKALAVEAGNLSKGDLLAFYRGFTATVASAHQKLLIQSGAFSLVPDSGENWFTRILETLHLTARAQTGNTPFGGQIGLPIFCPCSAGFWVTVGPPRPASLFVSVAFMATPLFYQYRSLRPGAWWLGLYNPAAQIPCLSAFFCTPIGTGGGIVMVGTSL